jgi:peroxiredoxin
VSNLIDSIRKNRWVSALVALTIVFAVMNGLLLVQNLQLRKALSGPTIDKLKTGDVLAPFVAKEMNGASINVNYAQSSPRRVLLFFSPHCPYCRKQFPSWSAIMRDAPARGFEVLALAKDSEDKSKIEEFLKSLGCPPESKDFKIALISEDVRASYKFNVTPTTLIVSSTGVIQNAWNGMLTPDDTVRASASLGISLPPQ